jgi:protein-S-isoprenylcysteine O-methyltransferase Ste14
MTKKALVAAPFGGAFGVNAVSAHAAFERALSEPTGHEWSLAVFILLRAAVFAAFAALLIVRRPASKPARAPVALAGCVGALVSVAAIQLPAASSGTQLVAAGDFVALVGGVVMVIAIVWLGRCFSVLPEVRGLVTAGPYRFVRHPLYLGELTACLGLIVANPSARNLTAGTVFACCQTVRMRLEEETLAQHYPDYAAYAAVTPRLLPTPKRRQSRTKPEVLESFPSRSSQKVAS